MTKNKLNDIILKNLYSNNETHIFHALEDIAEKGNSGYIPSLIDLLATTESEEVKLKISKILSEIKHTDAVEIFIEAIENQKYSSIQEILVRICWENGLDFTNYFSTFIDLLINGDYMIAFEAYTVIESSDGNISEISMKEYIEKLKNALLYVREDRKTLIHHIIQFLPGIVKT